MTDNHPITVPAGSITGWKLLYCNYQGDLSETEYIVLKSAQWGADKELEACCEYIAMKGKWFADSHFRLKELRAARRPKPSSLREQALEAMHRNWNPRNSDDFDIIRRALETLPND
jgi:hypothetical protein